MVYMKYEVCMVCKNKIWRRDSKSQVKEKMGIGSESYTLFFFHDTKNGGTWSKRFQAVSPDHETGSRLDRPGRL